MLKKALSLVFVLVLLVSCLPLSAGATRYNDYRHSPLKLYTPGVPQYLKGYLQYDPEQVDIVSDCPGYEWEGFIFPLASDDFDRMYQVDYTAENGLITFEYTLKSGYDLEYLLDCLDRNSVANYRGLVDRDSAALHELTIFDIALCYKYGDLSATTVALTDQINADGTVLYQDGKRLGSSYTINAHEYLSDFMNPETSTVKHKSLFLNQYQLTSDQLSSYEEFFRHKNANGEVDWELVRAKAGSDSDVPSYYEFGNRVLDEQKSDSPFTFNAGIYNAKRGRFLDITDCKAEDYPDLEAVWTEIGYGRLIGDMDGDNSLTVSDAAIIQRCAADITPYPEDDANPAAESNPDAVRYFSDFDADGDRGIVDATMIQRYIADMPHRTAEWSAYELPNKALHIPDDPSIPRITGFRSLGKGIEISIDPVPGAEKYRFYFKNKNGNWEKMGETTGAPFVSTNAVEVGKTYTYTVRCIKADLSKFTSDFDRTGWTCTYDPQLDTPQITRIEVTNKGFKVRWAPVEGADLYRLYYKENNRWTKVADTNSTSYEHANDILPGRTVTYTLQCLSMGGKGIASAYDPDGTSFELQAPPIILYEEVHMDGISFYVEGYTGNGEKIAVYRKTSTGWKRIGVVDDMERFTDTDVEPGKSYTYTARLLSPDGSYFVSRYNESGTTITFTADKCLPVLEVFVNEGEGVVWLQPRPGDKFNVSQLAVVIYSGGEYYGETTIATDKISVIEDDIFKNSSTLKLYVIGLDENGEVVTGYNHDGYTVRILNPADNLRVTKIGDRKYRFRWDKSPDRDVRYDFSLLNSDNEAYIGAEQIECLYYDVDLSNFSENDEWSAIVWATTTDGLSKGMAIVIDFCEADFNSETE